MCTALAVPPAEYVYVIVIVRLCFILFNEVLPDLCQSIAFIWIPPQVLVVICNYWPSSLFIQSLCLNPLLIIVQNSNEITHNNFLEKGNIVGTGYRKMFMKCILQIVLEINPFIANQKRVKSVPT